MYNKNSHIYEVVSVMNITKLHPNILKQHISINAKTSDVLFFNSFITHRSSNNLSSVPQLQCYSNLVLINYLINSKEKILDTWFNRTYLKKYRHFFTENQYK